jgi:hypothetical protein
LAFRLLLSARSDPRLAGRTKLTLHWWPELRFKFAFLGLLDGANEGHLGSFCNVSGRATLQGSAIEGCPIVRMPLPKDSPCNRLGTWRPRLLLSRCCSFLDSHSIHGAVKTARLIPFPVAENSSMFATIVCGLNQAFST